MITVTFRLRFRKGGEHSAVDVSAGDTRLRLLGLAEPAERSVVFSGERTMFQNYVGNIQRCDVKRAYYK